MATIGREASEVALCRRPLRPHALAAGCEELEGREVNHLGQPEAGERLEVRCCCRPEKLLGHIVVKEHECAELAIHRIVRERFSLGPKTFGAMAKCAEKIRLPIEPFRSTEDGAYRTWLAVKAEETAIEKLLRVDGFEPAPGISARDQLTNHGRFDGGSRV